MLKTLLSGIVLITFEWIFKYLNLYSLVNGKSCKNINKVYIQLDKARLSRKRNCMFIQCP